MLFIRLVITIPGNIPLIPTPRPTMVLAIPLTSQHNRSRPNPHRHQQLYSPLHALGFAPLGFIPHDIQAPREITLQADLTPQETPRLL